MQTITDLDNEKLTPILNELFPPVKQKTCFFLLKKFEIFSIDF